MRGLDSLGAVLIKKRWPEVKLVANALLRRRELDGYELLAVIKKAQPPAVGNLVGSLVGNS